MGILIKNSANGLYTISDGIALDDLMRAIMGELRAQAVDGAVINDALTAKFYALNALKKEKEEAFYCIFLSQKNNILDHKIMFKGTVNQSCVHVRPIVRTALELNAASLIIAHNHPAGSSSPSREDIDMTRRLQSALNVFDIDLIDHIVVGDNCCSLKELGINF